MKRETLATSGVLGLSVLIASCCLAPALFLLFGVSVSALGSLAVFEPVRPYFITAGGAILLYAGVRIFRPARASAPAQCLDGACAPESSSRLLTRRLFWVATAAYLSAVAYPTILATFYG